MLFSKIAFLSGLAAITAAQDTNFDFGNIPAECTDVCAQVGSITNGCKNDSNDNSSEVLKCICTANRANVLIPQCQACVRQYNGNNNNDSDNDDSYRLLTDCNYVTTTYNPSLATETVSVTDTNTVTNTDTNTVTNTNTDTVISTATVMPTGDDNDDDSNTSNPAAPMKTAGAALGLGAFGIAALGLL
ncbi:gpi anchored protein [Stemphylium lycopersici]|uniref:Gpi anchored protein n=1 Tax=Stemphylium lycopersici TaxID=183478 RepID=A0A364N2X8_STELY|nr:gpi anchored protein [Stemphylium lycopersici]RAR00180.1 gpi anchored protein [Stemphylium lycopersici]RAR10301.1 gpi anchored protein [Stemphylium lycopersici]